MTFRLSAVQTRSLQRVLTDLASPHTFDSRETWLIESMRSMKDLLGAQKAAVRLRTARGPVMISEDHEASALRDFTQYYHQFDYGRAIPGVVIRPRRIWTIEDQYGEKLPEFYRSAYYNDYQHPNRMYHCIATATDRRPADSDAILYFHRDRLSTPFGPTANGVMRLISPVFAAAVRLSGMTGPSYKPFLGVVDDLEDGCALFTPNGVLLHRNRALSGLVENQANGAELWARILEAVRRILGICDRSSCSGSSPSSSRDRISVGGMTYVVSGCVLGYFHDAREPAVMITVKCVCGQPKASTADLREKFNLSRREQDVARLVALRLTTVEIAKRLGISSHTVRHHTEHVMRKLGVHDRRDVVQAFGTESGGAVSS